MRKICATSASATAADTASTALLKAVTELAARIACRVFALNVIRNDILPSTPAAKGAGTGSNGSGGGLRRLVKGRTEPEPPEPQPETKIVRQQPVRQPRSRRSGKR